MGVKGLMKKEAKLTDEEIIERGSPVKSDFLEEKNEWINFNLRVKKKMLREIDIALEDIEGLSKTGFILQAIQEKLKKCHNGNNPID